LRISVSRFLLEGTHLFLVLGIGGADNAAADGAGAVQGVGEAFGGARGPGGGAGRGEGA